MSTIGENWREGLKSKELTPNQLPQPQEESASEFFAQLKNDVIPNCIEGAVEAGSTEIVLDAPVYAVGTLAYEEFQRWARAQGLEALLGGILWAEGAKDRDCSIAIRLTVPAT